MSDMSFDVPDDLFDAYVEVGWMKEPFDQTGSLPMSSAIRGTFVRWHNPSYFWSGSDFWKTFQDGPWKWEDQQRFAGSHLNCGHYFAIEQAGAEAEACFYGLDTQKTALLEIRAEFVNILDLTYEDYLVEVAKNVITNLDEITLMRILSAFVSPERGGNKITDFIGCWARQQGYEGILFFGARALESDSELCSQIDDGRDDSMMGPIVHGCFYRMRRQPELKNLVLFSGAGLTTRIQSYRLGAGEMVENQFYRASDTDLDRLLEYNSEYQQERSRIIMMKYDEPKSYIVPTRQSQQGTAHNLNAVGSQK